MSYQTASTLKSPDLVRILKFGGVAVVRTDTLYGLIALANDDQAVERVYQIKNRSRDKSPIVLISSIDQLFDQPTAAESRLLDSLWPGPNSVIIKGTRAPWWLKRENSSVAYRLPDHPGLQSLIEAVGPVIAPSANPESKDPAYSVEEAINYFGDQVDIYVDSGRVEDHHPSSLYRVNDQGKTERLR